MFQQYLEDAARERGPEAGGLADFSRSASGVAANNFNGVN